MAVLHVTFTMIIVVLTIAVIAAAFLPSFEDIKKVFAKKDNFVMEKAWINCRTNELFVEIEMPTVSKRIELIPVFIFRGNVIPAKQEKIAFYPDMERKMQIAESAALKTSPPVKGEMFTLALISDDEKCKNLVKGSPAFDIFTAECGRFVQDAKGFKLEKETEGTCLGQQVVQKPPLTMLKFDGAKDIGGNLCQVQFTVTNTGSTDWTFNDGVYVMVSCLRADQERYIPVGGLTAGKSEANWPNHPRECGKWDEDNLKKSGLWDNYKDGYKIKLYKGCISGFGGRIDCSKATEIKSTEFKC